eukprot:3438443-Rhodomonas_salina.3
MSSLSSCEVGRGRLNETKQRVFREGGATGRRGVGQRAREGMTERGRRKNGQTKGEREGSRRWASDWF